MKPTPEVKKEIERLNFLEIKSHTPYDYSLAHQTIRYDFMDDITPQTYMSKKRSFFYAIKASKEQQPQDIKNFIANIDLDTDLYPVPVKLESGYTCAIKIKFKNGTPPPAPIEISNSSILTPI